LYGIAGLCTDTVQQFVPPGSAVTIERRFRAYIEQQRLSCTLVGQQREAAPRMKASKIVAAAVAAAVVVAAAAGQQQQQQQ
jgi:hypothetical protein